MEIRSDTLKMLRLFKSTTRFSRHFTVQSGVDCMRTISRKPNIVGTGAWLLDLDPSLLNSVCLGSDNADKFRELFARTPFGYKDPRFSFTLGVLAPIIPKNTVYLCVFRHPLQVVESTKKHAFRSGIIVDDGYCFALWEAHYRCLLQHYQANRWTMAICFIRTTDERKSPLPNRRVPGCSARQRSR